MYELLIQTDFTSLFTRQCRLLITYANSLDPDQARRNVGPDLGPNCLTLMVLPKEFFEKVDFEKNQQIHKSMQNYPACKELIQKIFPKALSFFLSIHKTLDLFN